MNLGHPALAIANIFIDRASSSGELITPMKVQKLVYFAHGWTLAGLKRPLIAECFEAWEFGPVIPKLYHALKSVGGEPIKDVLRWGDDTPFGLDDGEKATTDLTEDEERLIGAIWKRFGHLNAFVLSDFTHVPGTPWSNVYEPKKNRPISNQLIQEYFEHLMQKAA